MEFYCKQTKVTFTSGVMWWLNKCNECKQNEDPFIKKHCSIAPTSQHRPCACNALYCFWHRSTWSYLWLLFLASIPQKSQHSGITPKNSHHSWITACLHFLSWWKWMGFFKHQRLNEWMGCFLIWGICHMVRSRVFHLSYHWRPSARRQNSHSFRL